MWDKQINTNINQLEKLEAAKAAYLWLPLDNVGYLWLAYLSLPVLTFSFLPLNLSYISLPVLTFPFLTYDLSDIMKYLPWKLIYFRLHSAHNPTASSSDLATVAQGIHYDYVRA